jgi:AraC-like DNA-binding protein/quercetin dioxygenase-like cupin family protein
MSQARQRLTPRVSLTARVSLTVEQEPFLVLRSVDYGFPSGFILQEHAHEWHQLLYATSGAMTVQAARCSWMIPPGKAVFIPARCPHGMRMWGSVAMRSLYFPTSLDAPALNHAECRVLSVTPLLRELILRVVELAALDSRVPDHARLLGVLLDEMNLAAVTPLALPLPADPRAAAVAQSVLADPARNTTLDDLARRHGVGRRTLERLFRNETGISFGLWQQKARLLHSVRALAEGKSVTEAALDAGYSSVSAFIAAFKRTFGCTPGSVER